MVDAVQSIAAKLQTGEMHLADISEESLSAHLYAPDLPEPDLLIRTSGEMRLSNFLLWQLAYAEIVVTDTLWPDFRKAELWDVFRAFAARERRFGKTSAQLRTCEDSSDWQWPWPCLFLVWSCGERWLWSGLWAL